MTPVKEIDMQSMGRIRQASQKISAFLNKRLNGYVQTLTPLFAPAFSGDRALDHRCDPPVSFPGNGGDEARRAGVVPEELAQPVLDSSDFRLESGFRAPTAV